MRLIATSIIRFVSQYTSYSFSIAFLSIFSGILAYVLSVSFAQAAGVTFSYELYNQIIIFIGVNALVHAVFTGIFQRFGIPGMTKTIRILNHYIQPDLSIPTNLKSYEYKKILSSLGYLPFQNSLISSILVAILYIIIVFGHSHDFGFMSLESFYLVGITIFLIIFFIHGGLSFLFSEIMTGYQRAECKRIMHQKSIIYQNRSISNLRIKFYFFMGFIVLAISSSNALHMAYFINLTALGIFLFLSLLVLYIGNRLIIFIILQSLKEINDAMIKAENGESAFIFSKSLDVEFLALEDRLSSTARKVSKFQHDLERKVDIRTKELLKLNDALREKDANIQLELSFASDLQKGIVPSRNTKWNELEISVYWEPMETVTGDYYDIFNLKEGNLGIVSADVSGHGIPAALITAMAKISFSTAGNHSKYPDEIYKEVNTQLSNIITTQDYLTSFFISVDTQYRFLYGNASHPPGRFYHYNTDEISNLDTKGMFIGAMETANEYYEAKEEILLPGDRLIIYTDGIIDLENEKSEYYGIERLDKAIKKSIKMNAQNAIHSIVEDMKSFAHKISDDMTLIIISRSIESINE